MAKAGHRGVLIRACLVLFSLTTCSATNCFEFPTLGEDKDFYVAEGASVDLPFYLNSARKSSNWSRISVLKEGTEQGTGNKQHGLMCMMTDICPNSPRPICTCFSNGTYILRKTAQRDDAAVWIWRLDDVCDTKVFFIIGPDVGFSTTTSEQDGFLNRSQDRGINFFTIGPRDEAGPMNDDSTQPDGNSSTILGGIGIVCATATVITVIVVCARKGSAHTNNQPGVGDQVVEENELHDEQHHEEPAYHYYFEIKDASLRPTPGTSGVCQPASGSTPEDGYLVPLPVSQKGAAALAPQPAQMVPDDGYLTPASTRRA